MHPVSVRVHAASSPSSRGPLSYRQTRRQKQLLGCDMYVQRSLGALVGFWDSRILPGPAAERVPTACVSLARMPLSLSRGACIVEAAVWIPNFVPPPFSHRCQQTQWEK
ncbi:hypothetical protein GGI42DRAFT_130028 [Trichoderma sp. SZMC 28013]